MLAGLNFVMVHVPELRAVRDFYVEKFGLTVESETPTFVQFVQPGGRGAIFALFEDAAARPSAEPELWWSVDDLDATYADLMAKGVKSVEAPSDRPFGRVCSVSDPAGNTIFLQKPR